MKLKEFIQKLEKIAKKHKRIFIKHWWIILVIFLLTPLRVINAITQETSSIFDGALYKGLIGLILGGLLALILFVSGHDKKKINIEKLSENAKENDILEKIVNVIINKFGAEKDSNSIQEKVKEITQLEMEEKNLPEILEILENKKSHYLDKKAKTSFILGIIAITTSLVPVIGVPIEIIGIMAGKRGLHSYKKRFAKIGIILCSVGVIISIISGTIGFLQLT